MLAIEPRDPHTLMARAGFGRRLALRLNKGFGLPVIDVPEIALPFSLETLIEEMRRHNPDLTVIAEASDLRRMI